MTQRTTIHFSRTLLLAAGLILAAPFSSFAAGGGRDGECGGGGSNCGNAGAKKKPPVAAELPTAVLFGLGLGAILLTKRTPQPVDAA